MGQDTAEPIGSESTAVDGAKLSRTRGLMPPWRPGQSGNPSGLTREGTSTKGHAIRARLLAKLEAYGGKRTWSERIVDGWVKAAEKGSAPHLAMILDRLYPVPQDKHEGMQVLTGLRLELKEGSAAVTLLRGAQASSHGTGELPEISETGVPEGGVHAQRILPQAPRILDVEVLGSSSESQVPETSSPVRLDGCDSARPVEGRPEV